MKQRFKSKVIAFLKQGLSPGSIAKAVALGITLGVFPIYGPVSILCVALAFLFRLNAALIFLGSWTMIFVKPLLILPFLKLGEQLFVADPMPISIQELWLCFSEQPMATLVEFSWSFLHATVGWLVVAPLIFILAYAIVHALTRRWHAKLPMG